MIRQIIIENYKSIHKATIDLAPINVLIGANGAGKSNLLSFSDYNAIYWRVRGSEGYCIMG